MKLLCTAAILMMTALTVTGCDFVRSLMGKPTSAELEQMRIDARKEAEREKFVADSIKAAQEAAGQADMEKEGEMEELPAVKDTDPRFHVIVGCFKIQDNAVNYREMLTSKGYTPKRILFKNGYDAVSLIQEDTWMEAMVALERFIDSPLCPDDVWIYDMNQKLHE